MAEFIIDGKTKVKRLLPAIVHYLSSNSPVKILGIGQGSIKAIVIAEKLKTTHQSLSQLSSIYLKDNVSVLELHLSFPPPS